MGEERTGINAFNLKMTVDSVCDTVVAAAPNLLLPLSHFYPPLKRRALSVQSVLGNSVKQTAMEKWTDNRTKKKSFYASKIQIPIMFEHAINLHQHKVKQKRYIKKEFLCISCFSFTVSLIP